MRHAIDLAIPRQAILNEILSNAPQFSNYVLSTSFMHSDDQFFDPRFAEGGEFGPMEDPWFARQLLFDAGYDTIIVDPVESFLDPQPYNTLPDKSSFFILVIMLSPQY